jgi:hypothetical protein
MIADTSRWAGLEGRPEGFWRSINQNTSLRSHIIIIYLT